MLGKSNILVKIILYFIGGGGHKHSDGQRNEITESSNTERTNEELIQSRSIDHLLCGGDGNKPHYKDRKMHTRVEEKKRKWCILCIQKSCPFLNYTSHIKWKRLLEHKL